MKALIRSVRSLVGFRSYSDGNYNGVVWKGGGVVVGLILFGLTMQLSGATKSVWTVKALRVQAERVAVVELPAKAAEIISEHPENGRERFAVRVVRVFLRERHSLAPSLVGAICSAVPEVSVAVATEAVKLFPESAYSIVKAAIASSPEMAVSICLQASIESPEQSKQIVNGLRRAHPTGVTELTSLMTTLSLARVEMIDAAIRSTRIRVGTSFSNLPADPNDFIYNNPPGQQQLKFLDGMEVPENLSGSELLNMFDRIRRLLLVGDGTQFDDDVVIERYVQ